MARKTKKRTARRSTKKKTTRRKTKKKSTSRRKAGEMLLVGSKAKAFLKKKGCNTGGDALDGLNVMVHWYLEQASMRAKANGRKTVRAHDFITT